MTTSMITMMIQFYIHLHSQSCRRAEPSLSLLLSGNDEQDEVLLVRVLEVQLLKCNGC